MTPEEKPLQGDPEARQAERRESADTRTGRWGWRPVRKLGCGVYLLLAIIGLIIGFVVGGATAPPPDPNDIIDLTPLGRALDGAVIGVFAGLLVARVIAWILGQSDDQPGDTS